MNRILIAAAFAAALPLAACSDTDSRYDRDSRTYDRSGTSGSSGSPLVEAPAAGVNNPAYGTSGQAVPQGQNLQQMDTNVDSPNRAGTSAPGSSASPAYPASPGYRSGY